MILFTKLLFSSVLENLLQQSHKKRVKNFFLPVSATAFWCLALLSLLSGVAWLMILCGIVFFSECLSMFKTIRKRSIPMHLANLIMANFRSYMSLLYHLCSFVSRYYLFWSFPFFLLLPDVSFIILSMHLVAGMVEYIIRRPSLNFPLFFLLFSLDQLFYQLGVWRGCIKGHFWGPINPRILRKPLRGEQL